MSTSNSNNQTTQNIPVFPNYSGTLSQRIQNTYIGIGKTVSSGLNTDVLPVKETTDILSRRTGYQIILENDKFHYVKITGNFEQQGEHLWKLMGGFATRKDCIVFIDRNAYYVTEQDVARSIVRASRKIPLKRGTLTYDDFKNRTHLHSRAAITGETNSSSKKTGTDSSEIRTEAGIGTSETGAPELQNLGGDKVSIRRNKIESGLNELFGSEVVKDVDVASEKQERALLRHLLEEEGEYYEIEENSQSR